MAAYGQAIIYVMLADKIKRRIVFRDPYWDVLHEVGTTINQLSGFE